MSILWVKLQNIYCFYLNNAFLYLIFFCFVCLSIWLAHAQYQFFLFVQIHSVDKVFKCSSLHMGNLTNFIHRAFVSRPCFFSPIFPSPHLHPNCLLPYVFLCISFSLILHYCLACFCFLFFSLTRSSLETAV